MDIHPDLHAAPVTPVDAAVGGLGGHHKLHLLLLDALGGEELVDDVLPAHAVAVLLLDGAHHHDLVAVGDQPQLLHDLGAVGGGGHAALLVGAAPAVDHRIILVALVGVGSPVVPVAHAHGVDVGVKGDDLVALAHPADHVAQAVHFHRIVAQLLHLGLDAGDHLFLLAALAGVGDHGPQEAGHVGLITGGGGFDLLVIHVHVHALHHLCPMLCLLSNQYSFCGESVVGYSPSQITRRNFSGSVLPSVENSSTWLNRSSSRAWRSSL